MRRNWAFVFLAAAWMVAMVPSPAAEPSSLAERPRFRELLVGLQSLNMQRTVRLTAEHAWLEVPCEDPPCNSSNLLFLTYNGEVPGPPILMHPGSSRQVELRNALQHMNPEEIIEAWKDTAHPVLRRRENAQVKNFISQQSAITNLHTHGLHISPQGSSDNVMLRINQGKSMRYTFDVPANHAPGTHWYHAHLHGATALQVRGGMSGPLIVQEPEDQRLSPEGDFDVEERVIVLGVYQGGRIQPGILPQDLEPSLLQHFEAQDAAEKADPAEAVRGMIDLLTEQELRQLVEGMAAERRQKFLQGLNELRKPPTFAVNGDLEPVLELEPLAVQRLRIVNAGSKRKDYKRVYIEGHKIYLAAFDGINLREFVEHDEFNPLVLAPGNRADVFFVPKSTGQYSMLMEGDHEVLSLDEPEALRTFSQELMTFDVESPGGVESLRAMEDSEQQLDRFLTALSENLRRLQNTAPYQTYLRPITERPEIRREIVLSRQGGSERARTSAKFFINERDYNKLDADGQMQGHSDYLGKEPKDGGEGPGGQSPWPPRAGTLEEWTITNTSDKRHPFHIHVNPFWVPALGRWQDTIDVPSFGSVTIWHRFSEHVGLYVIHCHILQHEDRGMMMNILTVPKEHDNPGQYFNQQRNANCRLNNQINGTTDPCDLPE